MAGQPPSNIYTGMTFPPYAFREFPKEVTRPDGSRVIVGNQREELEAMIAPTPQPLAGSPESERDALAQQLAEERAQRMELERKLAALEAPAGGAGSVPGGDYLSPGEATQPLNVEPKPGMTSAPPVPPVPMGPPGQQIGKK